MSTDGEGGTSTLVHFFFVCAKLSHGSMSDVLMCADNFVPMNVKNLNCSGFNITLCMKVYWYFLWP